MTVQLVGLLSWARDICANCVGFWDLKYQLPLAVQPTGLFILKIWHTPQPTAKRFVYRSMRSAHSSWTAYNQFGVKMSNRSHRVWHETLAARQALSLARVKNSVAALWPFGLGRTVVFSTLSVVAEQVRPADLCRGHAAAWKTSTSFLGCSPQQLETRGWGTRRWSTSGAISAWVCRWHHACGWWRWLDGSESGSLGHIQLLRCEWCCGFSITGDKPNSNRRCPDNNEPNDEPWNYDHSLGLWGDKPNELWWTSPTSCSTTSRSWRTSSTSGTNTTCGSPSSWSCELCTCSPSDGWVWISDAVAWHTTSWTPSTSSGASAWWTLSSTACAWSSPSSWCTTSSSFACAWTCTSTSSSWSMASSSTWTTTSDLRDYDIEWTDALLASRTTSFNMVFGAGFKPYALSTCSCTCTTCGIDDEPYGDFWICSWTLVNLPTKRWCGEQRKWLQQPLERRETRL